MARIRSIKPEFWSSEQVMECSPLARLFFIGLWNFCDDAGNHPASEKTLKALVFPGDSIDSTTIRRLIVELSSNGLLRLYEASGKSYVNVRGWHHQKIEKPTIKHPCIEDGCEIDPRVLWAGDHVVGEESSNSRRIVDDSSTPERRGEDREKIKSTVEHRKVDDTPYAEILNAYQTICAGKFLGAEVLTKERKRNIQRTHAMTVRGKQPFRDGGIEFWNKFFSRCTTNRHWCGDNDRGWKASLEFVTRESNVLKVLGV